MLELWRKQVIHSVVKGIKSAQKDYKRASESLLLWGPEYLITVNIFQSLLKIPALENSIVLEMKPSEVSEVKTRGPKFKNSRVGNRCHCDIVLWSGKDSRRVIIEVKRYAQDCKADIGRVTQLLKEAPSAYYAVLAACVQREVKNGNVTVAKAEITKKLKILSEDIREQAAKNGFSKIAFTPENINRSIKCLKTKDDNGEITDWVWRPVCFVIYNKNKQ
jgi:hypothetical protein